MYTVLEKNLMSYTS